MSKDMCIGETVNREVKAHGNGGYIYCPKKWVGQIVRVEVIATTKGAKR